MWFIYALSFAVLSSISVVIAKKVMISMDQYSYLFVGNFFGFFAQLAILLIFFQIPKIDLVFIYSVLASSAIGSLGGVLAYKAIRESEISLVGPIASFNPVFTALISFFTLKEAISFKEISGIIIIVIGTYLLEISKTKKGLFAPIKGLITHKGVQLSFIAYFLWAVTPTFDKTALFHTQPQTPSFVGLVGVFFSAILYGLLTLKFSKNKLEKIKNNSGLLLLVGILGAVGAVVALTAFGLQKLGLVTAIFKLNVIFSVILGAVLFKEKNIKDRLLGSLVMLAGVILLVT